MNKMEFPKRPDHKCIALVLQGGGALGAYQVGVYQALEEYGFAPDWVAGTSIGAINAAIIVGNQPGDRLARLEEFWRTVSRTDGWEAVPLPDNLRQFHSQWSVLATALEGRPGFFAPRWPNPFNPDSAETASYYDTSELRRTLQRLVDFDLINDCPTRLSLGVVQVTTGRLRYFDNQIERIGPEHIMASGALPPSFPAVRVDGKLYWDGGIYSNTPLEVVLDDQSQIDTLCFMVALFNPAGPEPHSIPEVQTRHKDIMYGTRYKQHIENYCRLHSLRRAVRALYERLPQAVQDEPEMAELAKQSCHTTMDIVALFYNARRWELAIKDGDFSWTAIEERRAQGYDDTCRSLKRAPWLEPVSPHVGVAVHEVSHEPEPENESG